MEGIPGVADLQVEQQVLIPQLHISVNREAAARVGFTPATLTDAMETATKGKVVGQVLDGLKVFDITLTLDDHHRTDPTALGLVRLVSPTGAIVLVQDVAEIVEKLGPNEVQRESLRRRIVVSANVRGARPWFHGRGDQEIDRDGRAVAAGLHDPVRRPVRGAQQESTRLLLALARARSSPSSSSCSPTTARAWSPSRSCSTSPSRSWGASPRSPSPASPSAWPRWWASSV
jgi:hypothetical protein